jgi:hypothetical protein
VRCEPRRGGWGRRWPGWLARAKLKKELASDTLELAQILAERPSASGGQGCANWLLMLRTVGLSDDEDEG